MDGVAERFADATNTIFTTKQIRVSASEQLITCFSSFSASGSTNKNYEYRYYHAPVTKPSTKIFYDLTVGVSRFGKYAYLTQYDQAGAVVSSITSLNTKLDPNLLSCDLNLDSQYFSLVK